MNTDMHVRPTSHARVKPMGVTQLLHGHGRRAYGPCKGEAHRGKPSGSMNIDMNVWHTSHAWVFMAATLLAAWART